MMPKTSPRTPYSDVYDQYFMWLADHSMGDEKGRYHLLLTLLADTTFVVSIAHDENRASDGKLLRLAFNDTQNPRISLSPVEPECSVLEALLGIATRMNDILYRPERQNKIVWHFKLLLNNLGLLRFTDDFWVTDHQLHDVMAADIVNRFLYRTYDRDGNGGLFPIKQQQPIIDQRYLEIWYQMQIYLEQNFEF